MEPGEIIRQTERLLGEQVVSSEALAGGENSSAFLVATAAKRYVVKRYRSPLPGDRRDRLRSEFAGLCFLRSKGISQVPEPCGCDAELRLGVYRYRAGRKLTPGEITVRHLGRIATFLAKLYALRHDPEAAALPEASEACLHLENHIAIVDRRLARLRALPERNQLFALLHAHLDQEVAPRLHHARRLFGAGIEGLGLDPRVVLAREHQILSPSDLGFQNILVTAAGELIFVDFEYFGWDDPAKLVADFFLQPAVPLPPALRRPFFDQLGFVQADDPGFVQRLPFAYLFSALKWSLLVLNCFFADDRAAPGDEGVREEKLMLSRKILRHLDEELAGKTFPLDLL